MRVDNWKQFRDGRHKWNTPLLRELDRFKDPILITGCQRSGTTMLTKVFTKSKGIANFGFGKNSELDGALMLAGIVDHQPTGRCCFQTTYLNECYSEYFAHSGYKIIWVIRNPFSVVHSMVNNWPREALDELFSTCGSSMLTGLTAKLYKLFGVNGINNLNKACFAYAGKISQLFEIRQNIDRKKMAIIDYDELVTKKEIILPRLYEFVGLPYDQKYSKIIHSKSLNNKQGLSKKAVSRIEKICIPVYREAKTILTKYT